jgi:hypothetical protein
MRAEEMKKITEQAKLETANKFWDEFKEILFDKIQQQARFRQESITIEYSSYLAKIEQGDSWTNCKYLRDKAQQELEELGYEFYYNDRDGYVTISW